MKRLIKKILHTIIYWLPIFGFALIIPSGYSSALQFDVNSIPFYTDDIYYYSYDSASSVSHAFTYGNMFYSGYDSSGNFYSSTLNGPLFFNSQLNGTDKCQFLNGRDVSDNDSFVLDYDLTSDNVLSRCNSLGKFGSDSKPSFNNDSFPLYVFGTPNYESFLPYSFEYSKYFLHSEYIDSQTSYHYNYALHASDIFKDVKNFSYLQIPTGHIDSESFGEVTAGRAIKLNGRFDFEGLASNENILTDQFREHGVAYILTTGLVSNSNGGYDVVSQRDLCQNASFYTTTNPSGDTSAFFEYSCDFTSRSHFYSDYISFTFVLQSYNEFESGYSDSMKHVPVWNTDVDWSWSGMFVTTDNDSTSGGKFGESNRGNYYYNSPGYIDEDHPPYNNSDNIDFLSTLSNLFSFLVINPFQNLWSLFNDNSSCVNIPILSGMLNTSSSVCPFFSSSVRDILTPVMSVSSVMLIFGFAVRWLKGGSSSGDLDVIGGDVGSLHIGRGGKK